MVDDYPVYGVRTNLSRIATPASGSPTNSVIRRKQRAGSFDRPSNLSTAIAVRLKP